MAIYKVEVNHRIGDESTVDKTVMLFNSYEAAVNFVDGFKSDFHSAWNCDGEVLLYAISVPADADGNRYMADMADAIVCSMNDKYSCIKEVNFDNGKAIVANYWYEV